MPKIQWDRLPTAKLRIPTYLMGDWFKDFGTVNVAENRSQPSNFR
jgi:hypothetical protein